ncbi:MAG: translational GTPase TypA [SAR324 cluster bacterium]|uniref:Large ribosomal subunit assembly factor BipA n=1 Tax=SAR324 cluster bacterium TaxID=2024889 RepID=A0A2A4SSZ8_9DELT|nr:MAG: translational GTPase TypA [SAR324 cluster bacterium]
MTKLACNDKLRNIAIIAHVDHGKTTLVDALFKQSGLFREGQKVEERIMDSMDQERERGITISAKNCAVTWKGIKINIIDTPGHADFGGEVERSLSMADGAILLVDASEGPLPQTRFVLEKTLQAGLKIIVCINKIDRPDARIAEVLDEVYDLFIDLDATEKQLEFPVLYAIGRDGIAKKNLEDESDSLDVLFDAIINEVPGPAYEEGAALQMLVSDLAYSDYLGRLVIGRVFEGSIKTNDRLICIKDGGERKTLKITKVQAYSGMNFVDTNEVHAGDIAILAGIEDVTIGDTVCAESVTEALPRIIVDEPTVAMKFSINNGPFSGKEGKYVQSSRIRARLLKETLTNVSIKIQDTEDADTILVKGRGEFQIAILIETMRRENFEFCVGRPEVIYKYENGVKLEPIEQLFVDCSEVFIGVVTEKLSLRKGKMVNLVNHGTGRVRIEFSVPSRSLIGYRDEFLTDTKGTGIMNSLISGYEEFRGEFPSRYTGSLVTDRQGVAIPYSLFNLEPRGRLFVTPGEKLYEGMIIGEHSKDGDLNVNASKEKKLSNVRASGKDDSVSLSPIKKMTLEDAINFIREDELVEVTPLSIRLRKSVLVQGMRPKRKK